MATINTHPTERRFTPDRRSGTSSNTSRMTAVDWIAMTLLIIGGVNWGLVGLANFNLVAAIFGELTVISRVIYILVGLSALYSIYTSVKMSNNTD